MRLVYFDTSHLSTIGRAAAVDEPRFADFLKVWRARDCGLAFSRAHLIELRQHADALVREQRYKLLELLVPIYSDITSSVSAPKPPVLLEHKEVARAIVNSRIDIDVSPSREWLTVFPAVFESKQQASLFRAFEQDMFGNIVDQVRQAVELDVEARSRPEGAAYERIRVSDLEDMPIPPDRIAEAQKLFEEILLDEKELLALFPGQEINQIREQMAPYLEMLRIMIERSGEVGIRNAYAEAVGVTLKGKRDRRRLDHVTQTILHESFVEDTCHALGIEDDASIARIKSVVPLTRCPGHWLAREVELQIRYAEHEQDPSNAFDLDHVKYFPYVDLFFTDKRIANYIRAALRTSTNSELTSLASAISIPNELSALTAALVSGTGGLHRDEE